MVGILFLDVAHMKFDSYTFKQVGINPITPPKPVIPKGQHRTYYPALLYRPHYIHRNFPFPDRARAGLSVYPSLCLLFIDTEHYPHNCRLKSMYNPVASYLHAHHLRLTA